MKRTGQDHDLECKEWLRNVRRERRSKLIARKIPVGIVADSGDGERKVGAAMGKLNLCQMQAIRLKH